MLIDNAYAACQSNGFGEAEIGWILESNASWLAQIKSGFRDQMIAENHFRINQMQF